MYRDIIRSIEPLDAAAMEKCQVRLDNLTKPLGSLHALEHLARQMAGITCQVKPNNLAKSIIIVVADAAETADQNSQVKHINDKITAVCEGRAIVNTLAQHAVAALKVVSVDTPNALPGVSASLPGNAASTLSDSAAELVRSQIAEAINIGIHAAQRELARGKRILGLGVISAGAEQAAQAIAANYQAESDPIDLIMTNGSREIAVLVGVILAAAAGRAAIVLDGLATAVAALLAVKLAPVARSYLVGSHFSAEPYFQEVLNLLELPAYLRLNMRFGDGAGAALGMTLIDASLHVLNDMKTFGEAQVAVAQDGPGSLKQRLDITIE